MDELRKGTKAKREKRRAQQTFCLSCSTASEEAILLPWASSPTLASAASPLRACMRSPKKVSLAAGWILLAPTPRTSGWERIK